MVSGVIYFKSEVERDLGGHKNGNIPYNIRVIEVTELNFQVKSDIWDRYRDQNFPHLLIDLSRLRVRWQISE